MLLSALAEDQGVPLDPAAIALVQTIVIWGAVLGIAGLACYTTLSFLVFRRANQEGLRVYYSLMAKAAVPHTTVPLVIAVLLVLGVLGRLPASVIGTALASIVSYVLGANRTPGRGDDREPKTVTPPSTGSPAPTTSPAPPPDPTPPTAPPEPTAPSAPRPPP